VAQWACAWACGARRAKATVPALLERLEQSPENDVTIVEALGEIGDRRATRTLVDILAGIDAREPRCFRYTYELVLGALIKLEDPAALPTKRTDQRWVQVIETRGALKNGKVTEWQVTVKVEMAGD
jgi:HEAT repeat protein